jgi:putative ABC transport system substrate-binding protein
LFGGGARLEHGLVTNFARPGGNLTGFSGLPVELMPKRLELLSELVPQARVIATLPPSLLARADEVIE